MRAARGSHSRSGSGSSGERRRRRWRRRQRRQQQQRRRWRAGSAEPGAPGPARPPPDSPDDPPPPPTARSCPRGSRSLPPHWLPALLGGEVCRGRGGGRPGGRASGGVPDVWWPPGGVRPRTRGPRRAARPGDWRSAPEDGR
ncbi:bcl-2-binding component 3 isoform X1 [Sminthopsis crassicaudata]|uniref:bcl-2-binding component 3 isoform X1 n=1 Tax=Sminthopsis crassicaudata TaxID=9301 RepID=UPI003D69C38D